MYVCLLAALIYNYRKVLSSFGGATKNVCLADRMAKLGTPDILIVRTKTFSVFGLLSLMSASDIDIYLEN